MIRCDSFQVSLGPNDPVYASSNPSVDLPLPVRGMVRFPPNLTGDPKIYGPEYALILRDMVFDAGFLRLRPTSEVQTTLDLTASGGVGRIARAFASYMAFYGGVGDDPPFGPVGLLVCTTNGLIVNGAYVYTTINFDPFIHAGGRPVWSRWGTSRIVACYSGVDGVSIFNNTLTRIVVSSEPASDVCVLGEPTPAVVYVPLNSANPVLIARWKGSSSATVPITPEGTDTIDIIPGVSVSGTPPFDLGNFSVGLSSSARKGQFDTATGVWNPGRNRIQITGGSSLGDTFGHLFSGSIGVSTPGGYTIECTLSMDGSIFTYSWPFPTRPRSLWPAASVLFAVGRTSVAAVQVRPPMRSIEAQILWEGPVTNHRACVVLEDSIVVPSVRELVVVGGRGGTSLFQDGRIVQAIGHAAYIRPLKCMVWSSLTSADTCVVQFIGRDPTLMMWSNLGVPVDSEYEFYYLTSPDPNTLVVNALPHDGSSIGYGEWHTPYLSFKARSRSRVLSVTLFGRGYGSVTLTAYGSNDGFTDSFAVGPITKPWGGGAVQFTLNFPSNFEFYRFVFGFRPDSAGRSPKIVSWRVEYAES